MQRVEGVGEQFRLEYGGRLGARDVLAGERAALVEVGSFGEPREGNRLVFGDNLPALLALADDDAVAGKVRLVYIDPPYATGFRFESAQLGLAYDDDLAGAGYVETLRRRLIVLRELLAPDGSIYVHLDSNMVFPIKLVMDEVFGPGNFRNMISRVKCNPKNFTSRQFGDECDYILFYSKHRSYVWNQPLIPWEGDAAAKEYPYVDGDGRRFKKVPCHAPGTRSGATGKPWRGKLPPPGKHWVLTPERLEALDRDGHIYWSPTGNPRRKIYLDEVQGKRLGNVWSTFRDTQNQSARITGYPTEKNVDMMAVIVGASSNPGDLVLDCYAGSGTTLEAAARLDRRWIGIDSSATAVQATLARFVEGTARMGSYARGTYLTGSSRSTVACGGALLGDGRDDQLLLEARALLESTVTGAVTSEATPRVARRASSASLP